jgi:hypothetical protein
VEGTRGAILLAWKGSVCQHLNSRIDRFSISAQFVHEGGVQWWFTGVYGPQTDALNVSRLADRVLLADWVLLAD